ncbi:MAG: tripartite tricarboxylate transporter substrate binding protein [Burkholderiales bacterium]|nr:tripartite tricarboxylate transporter substrate binding protein [Burkholderiales bacterium]
MFRRFSSLIVAASLALFGASAHAVYPDKPIRLIVPWAPGGSTDAIARAIAQRMSESLGQSVVVDNRSGASGQIGTDAAAKSAPDGYTLAMVELPHAIAPAVVAKLPYDLLRDFTPVSLVGTSPLVLFATPSEFKTGDVKAFLQRAKSGKAPLAVAHSGAGSSSHLAAEVLASRGSFKYIPVPYRGSAPALTDVAAGMVAAHFATLASGSSLHGAGKLSPLMVTGPSRLPALPGVPTAREVGIDGMDFNQWWAVVAPATTPVEIVERLRSEVLAALNHPATRERLNTLGIDLKGSTRDELRSFMRTEVDRWGAIARKAGVKPE